MAWVLDVQRLGTQSHAGRVRTYGEYRVLVDGAPQTSLSGWMLEPHGPSGNDPHSAENHCRILAKIYPLAVHNTDNYSTCNYEVFPLFPMPGIALVNTGSRAGIVIHPGHPPSEEHPTDLWLSSIGCLNPSAPLASNQQMDAADSRSRVLALLDSLTTALGGGLCNKPAGAALPSISIAIFEPQDWPKIRSKAGFAENLVDGERD